MDNEGEGGSGGGRDFYGEAMDDYNAEASGQKPDGSLGNIADKAGEAIDGAKQKVGDVKQKAAMAALAVATGGASATAEGAAAAGGGVAAGEAGGAVNTLAGAENNALAGNQAGENSAGNENELSDFADNVQGKNEEEEKKKKRRKAMMMMASGSPLILLVVLVLVAAAGLFLMQAMYPFALVARTYEEGNILDKVNTLMTGGEMAVAIINGDSEAMGELICKLENKAMKLENKENGVTTSYYCEEEDDDSSTSTTSYGAVLASASDSNSNSDGYYYVYTNSAGEEVSIPIDEVDSALDTDDEFRSKWLSATAEWTSDASGWYDEYTSAYLKRINVTRNRWHDYENGVSTYEEFLETLSGISSDSSSNASGEAVVEYALQFLGTPYVWGGEDLENGIDCSGLVMQVYAHFGVELPHSSESLRNSGVAVENPSISTLQPGDIICYYGHVAIYMGDGKIVHSTTTRTADGNDGVQIGSLWNYRTVVAVRRIFCGENILCSSSDTGSAESADAILSVNAPPEEDEGSSGSYDTTPTPVAGDIVSCNLKRQDGAWWMECTDTNGNVTLRKASDAEIQNGGYCGVDTLYWDEDDNEWRITSSCESGEERKATDAEIAAGADSYVSPEAGGDSSSSSSFYSGSYSDTDNLTIRSQIQGIVENLVQAVKDGRVDSDLCAMANMATTVNSMIRAYQISEGYNVASATLEAIDKVKAGVDDASPINEIAAAIDSAATGTQIILTGGSGDYSDDNGVALTNAESIYASDLYSAGFDALVQKYAGVSTGSEAFAQCPYVSAGTSTAQLTRYTNYSTEGGSLKGFVVAVVDLGSSATSAARNVFSFFKDLLAIILGDASTEKPTNLDDEAQTALIDTLVAFYNDQTSVSCVSESEDGLALNSSVCGEYFGYATTMIQGNGVSSGASPGSDAQVAKWTEAEERVIAWRAADDRYSLSPFDTSSQYTFLGNIFYNLFDFATADASNSLAAALSGLGSVVVSSFTNLLPSASAVNRLNQTTGDCPHLATVGVSGTYDCSYKAVYDTTVFSMDYYDLIKRVASLGGFVGRDSLTTDEVNQYLSGSLTLNIEQSSNYYKYITLCGTRQSNYGIADANIAYALSDDNTKYSSNGTSRKSSMTASSSSLSDNELEAATEAAVDPSVANWASGIICVADESDVWQNEFVYYQALVAHERHMESMGFFSKKETSTSTGSSSSSSGTSGGNDEATIVSRGLKKEDGIWWIVFTYSDGTETTRVATDAEIKSGGLCGADSLFIQDGLWWVVDCETGKERLATDEEKGTTSFTDTDDRNYDVLAYDPDEPVDGYDTDFATTDGMSATSLALAQYYEENPIDTSELGYLSRTTGMTKDQILAFLDEAETFIARLNYDPTGLGPLAVPEAEVLEYGEISEDLTTATATDVADSYLAEAPKYLTYTDFAQATTA